MHDEEQLSIGSVGRPPLRESEWACVVVLADQLPGSGLDPVMAGDVDRSPGAIRRASQVVRLAVDIDDRGVSKTTCTGRQYSKQQQYYNCG